MAGNGRPGPVVASERVSTLDALRGFALFGILLVNVRIFAGPGYYLSISGERPYEGADRLLSFLITAFAEGKFIASFALLFGAGFALQAARAEEKGWRSGPLLARRLAVLGLFGALHAVLVWSGDILLAYALLGFLFLPLRRRGARTLLVGAVLVLGIPALLLLAGSVAAFLAARVPGAAEQIAQAEAPRLALVRDVAFSAQQVYTAGSYGEMTVQRLRELYLFYTNFHVAGPQIFAMILLGAAVARAGWLRGPAALEARTPTVARIAAVCLFLGLPLNVLGAVLQGWEVQGAGELFVVYFGQALLYFGAPLLAVGYLAGAALLFQRFRAALPTRRFAEVGRLALTNYLLQSVLMTAVFYGLGLYGRVGLATALGLVLAVYAFHFAASYLWLSFFPSGPTERLWRRLTYGSPSKSG